MSEGEAAWQSYCTNCDLENRPGTMFCGECRARVTRVSVEDPQVIPEPLMITLGAVLQRRKGPLSLRGSVGVLLLVGCVIALLGCGGEEHTGSSEGQSEDAVGVPEEKGQLTTTVSVPPPEVTTAPEPTTASPEPTTSNPTTSAPDKPRPEGFEAQAEEAAGDYYRAAGRGDWAYTYEHLDSETQSRFTREEWFKKNQWFADNGEVIYHIESVERLGTSSGIVVGVTVRLTYEDGSSSTRDTYFVYEEREWKHAFGQEEYDLFMPDLSYEEFVEARQ
jgi:hypothetical protein